MDLLLIFRASKLIPIINNLEDTLNLKEEIQAAIDLCKQVIFVIIVSHFCACAWHYLGYAE